MSLHPQVASLLERVARSPLPPYHAVPPFVARRIYRDTRAALAPQAPEVADLRLQIFDNAVAVRSYRPVRDELLPALTAGYDPLVDEGRAYAERLAQAGVEVGYREYSEMVHGFVLFGGVVDTANAAVDECCRQLRAAFEKVTA